jgi:hypothetical protein
VALGLVGELPAIEYFVEKGGDDANPGTRMRPFKTIQKAAGVMAPGDVCTVSRGVYRETIRPALSGKPGSPLLFQAATGETVTLSGADEWARWQPYTGGVYRANAQGMIQVLVAGSPAQPCPAIPSDTPVPKALCHYEAGTGDVYLKLPGKSSPDDHPIEIQTRAWGLDAAGLSNLELKGFNLVACGVNLTNSVMCRLDDCHIWWNGSPAGAVQMGGKDNEIVNSSIIGSSGFGAVLLPEGVNNRVINSLFRGRDVAPASSIGIFAQGTAPTVRHVSVLDCSGGALLCSNVMNARIEYNDFHHAGAGFTNTSLVRLTGDGKGTILAFNWVHDNAAVGGVGIRFEGPVENYVVRQSVIWAQPGAGIKLVGDSGYNFIFNNTAAGNGCGVDAEVAGKGVTYRETRFMNNILVGPVWPSSGGAPPSKLEWRRNFTGSNPGFVDATNRNFTLAAGSPCIDAGEEEPEFMEDFTGSRPDVGAYEVGKEYPVPGCHVTENANKAVAPVVKIVMDCETPGAEVRYTLDGRVPDASSPLYTGAVPVIYGAMVKAKAFRQGMEESTTTHVEVRQLE